MGNRQYVINYYGKNGALTYWNTWASSESQAIVAFNNYIREQQRYSSVAGDPKWGQIYKVEVH